MELGVYTFAELSPDPATGRAVEIELFGTEVAPVVRAEVARRRAAAA